MSVLVLAAAMAIGQAEPIKWDLAKVFSTSENLTSNRMWVGFTTGLGGKFYPSPYAVTNDTRLYAGTGGNGEGYLRGWGSSTQFGIGEPAVIKNTDPTILEYFNGVPVPPGHFMFLCSPVGNSFPSMRFRVGIAGRQRIVGRYSAGSLSPMEFRIFLRRNGVLSFIYSKSVPVGTPADFDIRTAPLDPVTDVIEFQSGRGYGTFTANIFGAVP